MEVSTHECLFIQAYGLDRCENCPFDYEGDPVICGGKRFKKLIAEGRYPARGRPSARWFLKGMDYAHSLEKKRIAKEARARKALLQRNLVSRLWYSTLIRLDHWLGKGGQGEKDSNRLPGDGNGREG